ncbi:hypothetical protein ACFZCM_31330 [Streptomyces rochei]|uniref:DUF7426 family protein n=1 Tax=Streptomyces rochei TaxID=1928 RepID=UPI0036DFC594
MAATFEALGDFLDDYLQLPVLCKDGETRVFSIASPPAEDGLRVDRITKAAAQLFLDGTEPDQELLDDAEERDIFRLVLGDVHDDMLAQVQWSRFRHAAMTAMVWVLNDRDTAARFWSGGGDPSLLAPNRAARRQQKSAPSASAAANTTRSRGSTSGTRAGSRQRRKRGPKAGG